MKVNLKSGLLLLFSYAVLAYSCEETPKKHPSNENNKTEGVTETKEEAMERAREWAGKDQTDSTMHDSTAAKDSVKKDSLKRN